MKFRSQFLRERVKAHIQGPECIPSDSPPWRKLRPKERATLSYTPSGIVKLLSEIGPVATPLLDIALEELPPERLPFPLEAYVCSCVDYLKDIPRTNHAFYLQALLDTSPVAGILTRFALQSSRMPIEDARQWIHDLSNGPTTSIPALELAFDFWRASNRSIVDLHQIKTDRPHYGKVLAVPLYPNLLLPEEKTGVKTRLLSLTSTFTKHLADSSLDLNEIEWELRPLLEEDPSWAKEFFQPLVDGLLPTLSLAVPSCYTDILDTCLRYRVSLPDSDTNESEIDLEDILAVWLNHSQTWSCEYEHRSKRSARFQTLMSLAKDPQEMAASLLATARSAQATRLVVPYLSIAQAEHELIFPSNRHVLSALPLHPHVNSNLELAQKVMELSPRTSTTFLKKGSALVQQYVIDTGLHTSALVSLLKSRPKTLKPDVTLPAPALARALAEATKEKRAELLPLVQRVKRTQSP